MFLLYSMYNNDGRHVQLQWRVFLSFIPQTQPTIYLISIELSRRKANVINENRPVFTASIVIVDIRMWHTHFVFVLFDRQTNATRVNSHLARATIETIDQNALFFSFLLYRTPIEMITVSKPPPEQLLLMRTLCTIIANEISVHRSVRISMKKRNCRTRCLININDAIIRRYRCAVVWLVAVVSKDKFKHCTFAVHMQCMLSLSLAVCQSKNSRNKFHALPMPCAIYTLSLHA